MRGARTTVALTGIDLEYYAPATTEARSAARGELGLASDAFVILYAGRIAREKGVEVLVRALRLLCDRDEEARYALLVVGSPSLGTDPADSAAYVAELRAMGEGLPVTWVAGRRDILPLLHAADAAVVPSLWPEPLSRSVMEPLACGIPVVATRIGGNPEILTDWLADFLVEPGDAHGLAEQVERLRDWRHREPDLGQRCRSEAEARLSLQSELDLIEAALSPAATQRPARSLRSRRRPSRTEATSKG